MVSACQYVLRFLFSTKNWYLYCIASVVCWLIGIWGCAVISGRRDMSINLFVRLCSSRNKNDKQQDSILFSRDVPRTVSRLQKTQGSLFFLTAKRTIPLILGWKPMVTKVTRAASISIEFFQKISRTIFFTSPDEFWFIITPESTRNSYYGFV